MSEAACASTVSCSIRLLHCSECLHLTSEPGQPSSAVCLKNVSFEERSLSVLPLITTTCRYKIPPRLELLGFHRHRHRFSRILCPKTLSLGSLSHSSKLNVSVLLARSARGTDRCSRSCQQTLIWPIGVPIWRHLHRCFGTSKTFPNCTCF